MFCYIHYVKRTATVFMEFLLYSKRSDIDRNLIHVLPVQKMRGRFLVLVLFIVTLLPLPRAGQNLVSAAP